MIPRGIGVPRWPLSSPKVVSPQKTSLGQISTVYLRHDSPFPYQCNNGMFATRCFYKGSRILLASKLCRNHDQASGLTCLKHGNVRPQQMARCDLPQAREKAAETTPLMQETASSSALRQSVAIPSPQEIILHPLLDHQIHEPLTPPKPHTNRHYRDHLTSLVHDKPQHKFSKKNRANRYIIRWNLHQRPKKLAHTS